MPSFLPQREVASVHFVEGQLERACLQLSEGGRGAVCGPASGSVCHLARDVGTAPPPIGSVLAGAQQTLKAWGSRDCRVTGPLSFNPHPALHFCRSVVCLPVFFLSGNG